MGKQNVTKSHTFSYVQLHKICQGEVISLSHSNTARLCVIMPRLRKLLTFSLRIIFLLKRKIIKSLSLEYNGFFFHIYHWSMSEFLFWKKKFIFSTEQVLPMYLHLYPLSTKSGILMPLCLRKQGSHNIDLKKIGIVG